MFVISSARGLHIQYQASDGIRKTIVVLICELLSTKHHLILVGELSGLVYEFVLRSPCACPGGCDDFGIIQKQLTQLHPADVNKANIMALLLHDIIIFGLLVCIAFILKVVFDKTLNCYRDRTTQQPNVSRTTVKNKNIFPIVNSQRFSKLKQNDEEQLIENINEEDIEESDDPPQQFNEKNMKLEKMEEGSENSSSEA